MAIATRTFFAFGQDWTHDPYFTPTQVSGLTTWWGKTVNNGTDRTTLSDGAAITQWDDQTGNGYHLDSTAGSPVYSTTGTNGAIHLPDDAFLYSDGTAMFSSSVVSTMFFVTNWNVDEIQLFFSGDYSGNFRSLFSEANDTRINLEEVGSREWSQTGLLTDKVNALVIPNATGTNSKWYSNGTLLTPSVGGSGSFVTTATKYGIGCYYDSTWQQYQINKDWYYYEVIIYNRALTEREVKGITNYLRQQNL